MGLTLGNGTLYFGDGEKSCKVESVYVTQETTDDGNKTFRSTFYNNDTVTLEISTKISRNAYLSLIFGQKVTNNWLKLHGGIMTRRPLNERRRKLDKLCRGKQRKH